MALLDSDTLLMEISDGAPCGENLEYDPAFAAVEIEAKGIPERQVGGSIEPAQPPNWKNLRKMLLELMERTHDLRLLVELARTQLNLEGLTGFQEALSLLRKSLEKYWKDIFPQLDPDDGNDPTNRVNILMTLCDRDNFLFPLLNAPLVESRLVGRFSLRDVQFATGKTTVPAGQTAPQLSLIQGAFSEVAKEMVEATHSALKDSLDDMTQIETFVTQQVGVVNAPSFAPIREILKEAYAFVGERMEQLGLGQVTGGAGVDSFNDSSGSDEAGSGKNLSKEKIAGINNRQDVIRTLDLICEYYANHEPSSPVPLLVNRARRLVTMDFMEILQDLAPNGVSDAEKFKGPEPG